jgi:FAD/FMN-containing dehydrogenase
MKIGPVRNPWQVQRNRSSTAELRIDRRGFVGSTLAATVFAAVGSGRLWADAASAAAIPQQTAAVSGSGEALTLSAADLKDLRAALHGKLLLAQDAGYDAARRLWNPHFDRRPALIVRCADASDVVRAVNFARAHDLRTAVRAGGHSLSGQSACDGGLMIDVSPMKAISVDAKSRLAQAQGGVLLGELDRRMQAVGLATTLGTVTDTGIAGLTLGGGVGRLVRKYGLACDNLRSVELVTADGRLRRVSPKDDPDLFWGVRGGGGNFGVATAFEYQLHPLQHKVVTGERFYPYSQARSVIAALVEFAATAPDDVMMGASLINSSHGEHAGRFVSWSVDYVGDPNQFEKVIAPLRSLGKPLLDTMSTVSYLEAQGAEGAANAGVPREVTLYVKSGFLHSVPATTVDELVRQFEALPPTLDISAGMSQLGGAISRVAPGDTAYWNRLASFDLLLDGSWAGRDQDERNIKLIRDLWAGLEQYTRGYYVNTVPDADDQRLRATYGDNYPRLVQLKNQYDPGNLFRLNANIKPTAAV